GGGGTLEGGDIGGGGTLEGEDVGGGGTLEGEDVALEMKALVDAMEVYGG
nr:hypothetical protein [Tanacetum cinerariifolium]